ncbi:DNA mismatch repair protein mutS [Nannizzia gypsea CBS 118893]|uniref:DNA mismatch repair protein mutS n=1 Tax=Arthroderma gypseum (strain ATCC MYA-4604 / CBS 118893) TaxID=535722 RepID=E4UZM2_ARTGP|nr:DNA mismatch repair protein mutS [Nannizzia gypsea CBS 118893]EFR03552.1 DNA mismatch repair protein mutS [Nannizzia gypsea CBS 118893]
MRSHAPSTPLYPFTSDTRSPRPGTSRTAAGEHRVPRPTTAATTSPSQEIVCAISESRGISPAVGLAFVNLSTSEAVLSQICDSQTYARTIHKLAVFEPTEVLLMNTSKEPSSKLYAAVGENLSHIRTVTVDRKYWSEQNCHDYVERLSFKEDTETIKMALEGSYFSACCFAAALSYIELELSVTFAPHSLRLRYEPSEGSMMIDLATIVSLELIQNLQNAKSKDCLFGILNETLTPMGARLLRSNILQPSTEVSKLNLRYDAVEELSSNEEMFFAVRQALKSFLDSDRVLAALTVVLKKPSISYAEQSINNIIMLKTFISCIRPIYEALIQTLLSETLNDDVRYQSSALDLRNHRTYAVKAGVNNLLDVARQTYMEANDDVAELSARLSAEHGIPLDLRFESGRHYYFRVRSTDLQGVVLPDIFINVYRKKAFVEFQTLDLVKMNQKITDSHNEVISMSDRSIQELIDDVRTMISNLFRISEAIAMLDMIAAFAYIQATQGYVRPEITPILAIKAGRHPIREKIHSTKYIPNDIYASPQSRFQIITGCNMSGKSTYIRSLALMAVMAQIGSSVPAQYASFPIVHQLFARVSADDNQITNVSTFSTEMREMAYILRNIDAKSMVIVDELGRGTASTDGLAISIAIAEALMETHALVWFTTHFHDLARIMEHRSGVINLHLAVDMSEPQSKINMLYKIADGYVREQHYGLALARIFSLPPYLIEVADEVSHRLTLAAQNRAKSSAAISLAKRRRLLLTLVEQLMHVCNGVMEGEALKEWLLRLQREFTLRMTDTEPETESNVDDREISLSPRETEGSHVDVENIEAISQASSQSLPISPIFSRKCPRGLVHHSIGNSELVLDSGNEQLGTTPSCTSNR